MKVMETIDSLINTAHELAGALHEVLGPFTHRVPREFAVPGTVAAEGTVDLIEAPYATLTLTQEGARLMVEAAAAKIPSAARQAQGRWMAAIRVLCPADKVEAKRLREAVGVEEAILWAKGRVPA